VRAARTRRAGHAAPPPARCGSRWRERARAADDRGRLALQPAQRHLVAHVRAFPALDGDQVLAAHRADRRVGERAHDPAQRIGRDLGGDVRENQDFALRLGDRARLRGLLAAALGVAHEAHAAPGERGGDPVGVVGRAIGGDDHLERPGVGQRERLLELARERGRAVVHRDDHGERRMDLGGRHRPRRTARQQPEQDRVAEVGEAQPGETQADCRPDERHDALSARVRARMSARLRGVKPPADESSSSDRRLT
jgi:hypothetical protein